MIREFTLQLVTYSFLKIYIVLLKSSTIDIIKLEDLTVQTFHNLICACAIFLSI